MCINNTLCLSLLYTVYVHNCLYSHHQESVCVGGGGGVSHRDSGRRPTRSPCPWGRGPVLGSCRRAPGPAGSAWQASSWGPGRRPPYTGPVPCCWGPRTSRTRVAPGIGRTSAGPNSSGLRERERGGGGGG